MSENLKYILTLTIICFITATLLAGVYHLTQPKILEQKRRQEQQALKEVLPEAGYFEPILKGEEILYFKAYLDADKKKILGYAFKTQAQGYSSIIETMAGVATQGSITGIKILSQNETPGLGARINEVLVKETFWQAIKTLFGLKEKIPKTTDEPWFCTQYKGKKIEDLIVVQSPTERNIQAVTGATISSQALTDSVRERAKEIMKYGQ